MSLLSRASDTFYAFRFLRLLTTPWEETGAFKAGILDKDGKVINKPQTSEEKAVYNLFHRLVFNVKRLLNKVPFGKTTIASYITALFLIKEETGMSDEVISEILKEAFDVDIDSIVVEDTNDILAEGAYNLKHDIASPKTGEVIARRGTTVIAESNSGPIGHIFGYPQYEVLHMPTNKFIKVNIKDLES
jgi:hypothetical protein